GNTLELPGAYETASAVLGQIASNLRYDRPDDYIVQYKARNEAIGPADVTAAAKRLQPDALTYVVVGDLAKIEQPVRALALGEVTVLDNDGKPRSKE
ncbi:MAG TPA: insulinase family protein, partial [Pseudoxanthomonas sp.]|nr:insulinase family protein [Pseudoxanthomonas sp.]